MNITVYIDKNGKVTITDLPIEMLPMVNELSNKHSEYQCNGIAGFSGYSTDDIIKNLK